MTLDLPYNGTLKLTTSKYYIPSGRCIQAINYKHSNGGYTEHVPDSLTKVFYTSRGREVRDGGGIMPDVEVKADSVPNIAYYLAGVRDSNELLLNYQLDYIASHPVIAQPEQFDITDAEYEDFKQRVLKADFKYDRESEKYLKTLVKLAKFEGYYSRGKEEFERLKAILVPDLKHDLQFLRPQIEQYLTTAILARYYYNRGALERSVREDKIVEAARALLEDATRYRTLLTPTKSADTATKPAQQ